MWKHYKDMKDYQDRKVYTNYFADIVQMILPTVTNAVLSIIGVEFLLSTKRRAEYI